VQNQYRIIANKASVGNRRNSRCKDFTNESFKRQKGTINGYGRLLYNLVGLGVRRPGMKREIAHELAVSSVKLLPALRVLPRLEPVE